MPEFTSADNAEVAAPLTFVVTVVGLTPKSIVAVPKFLIVTVTVSAFE